MLTDKHPETASQELVRIDNTPDIDGHEASEVDSTHPDLNYSAEADNDMDTDTYSLSDGTSHDSDED